MNHLSELLHKVCRTAHPEWAAVEHMGTDHGGAHFFVPEELVDRVDVLPPSLRHIRGCVGEGMRHPQPQRFYPPQVAEAQPGRTVWGGHRWRAAQVPVCPLALVSGVPNPGADTP